MHATDRVVLVGAGFGVWHDGRHVSSARWTDVVRVWAVTRDERTSDGVGVGLRLRDGTEVLIRQNLPGFDPFLVAAEGRLPGMLRRGNWWESVAPPGSREIETVLFAR
jgi:hypothetical protein